jgi:hypothetical protein
MWAHLQWQWSKLVWCAIGQCSSDHRPTVNCTETGVLRPDCRSDLRCICHHALGGRSGHIRGPPVPLQDHAHQVHSRCGDRQVCPIASCMFARDVDPQYIELLQILCLSTTAGQRLTCCCLIAIDASMSAPCQIQPSHVCVATIQRLVSDAAHLEGCTTAVVKLPWHVHGACRIRGKLGNHRLKQGHLQRRTAAIACPLHGLLQQSAPSG